LKLSHAQLQSCNTRFELGLLDEALRVAVDEAIDSAPKRRHLACEPCDLLGRPGLAGRLADAPSILLCHAARLFQQRPDMMPDHLFEPVAAHG
jgi:hypothetical protein